MIATLFAQVQGIFPEQVTTNSLTQNIIYASGTLGALVILAGLLLVDMGGVRRVNVFDAVIQKIIAFFIGFVVYFLIGFAIWNWQYYVAFDIPSRTGRRSRTGGWAVRFAGRSRRTRTPRGAGLNNQQIFIFFLACFAGIINVLIGLAVTERIKASAYFAVAAVAAVVSSLLSWLTWGSTGPLTNEGVPRLLRAASSMCSREPSRSSWYGASDSARACTRRTRSSASTAPTTSASPRSGSS